MNYQPYLLALTLPSALAARAPSIIVIINLVSTQLRPPATVEPAHPSWPRIFHAHNPCRLPSSVSRHVRVEPAGPGRGEKKETHIYTQPAMSSVSSGKDGGSTIIASMIVVCTAREKGQSVSLPSRPTELPTLPSGHGLLFGRSFASPDWHD